MWLEHVLQAPKLIEDLNSWSGLKTVKLKIVKGKDDRDLPVRMTSGMFSNMYGIRKWSKLYMLHLTHCFKKIMI